uniref:Uncharacterized protein n=1 Tax=Pseudictyota dubia TaxID=2749911 RepID=A0A7R9W6E8_9STRA
MEFLLSKKMTADWDCKSARTTRGPAQPPRKGNRCITRDIEIGFGGECKNKMGESRHSHTCAPKGRQHPRGQSVSFSFTRQEEPLSRPILMLSQKYGKHQGTAAGDRLPDPV